VYVPPANTVPSGKVGEETPEGDTLENATVPLPSGVGKSCPSAVTCCPSVTVTGFTPREMNDGITPPRTTWHCGVNSGMPWSSPS
jgi:hypothetical protein